MEFNEEKMSEFDTFKFIVLCNGLYETGFTADERKLAYNYYFDRKYQYPHDTYELYEVDSEDDDAELERIRESYISYLETAREEIENLFEPER